MLGINRERIVIIELTVVTNDMGAIWAIIVDEFCQIWLNHDATKRRKFLSDLAIGVFKLSDGWIGRSTGSRMNPVIPREEDGVTPILFLILERNNPALDDVVTKRSRRSIFSSAAISIVKTFPVPRGFTVVNRDLL